MEDLKPVKNNNYAVSVIIPVYNCQQYLASAIESVLSQTYQAQEIVVVDDGSTDNSAAIAQSFAPLVTYSLIENSGSSTAVNHGINLAQGSLIGFLDSDDLWIENKLALQIAAFTDNPEMEAVFGHMSQFKSPELSEATKSKLKIPVEVIPAYNRDTLLIKRESLERVGLFDPKIRMGEFVDWYLKASDQGLKSIMLSEVLAKRRVHQTNMGIREHKSRIEYVRLLKASLDRRRKSGMISSPE